VHDRYMAARSATRYGRRVQNGLPAGAKGIDDLGDRRAFALAAAGGSFSSAARALGLSVSSVTRAIERLEQSLGARLFTRSTHRLALTEAGRTFHAHVERQLTDEAHVREVIGAYADARGGTLRVSVPFFVAHTIVPRAIERVRAAHPHARFAIHASNDNVDVVAGAYDLAVRTGRQRDSSLKAQRIASYRPVLVASRAFLAAHRPLGAPEDLARVPCIAFGDRPGRMRWRFRHKGREAEVAVEPVVVTNCIELLVELAIAGVGVTMVPETRLPASLSQVLQPWTDELATEVWAVHPNDAGKARLRSAFLSELTAAARE